MVENSMPVALPVTPATTTPADLAPERFLEWLRCRVKQESTARIYFKVALRWHNDARSASSPQPVLAYLRGLKGKATGTIGTCVAAALKWCTWWSMATGQPSPEPRIIRASAPLRMMRTRKKRARFDDAATDLLLQVCQEHLAPPGLWLVPLLVTSPIRVCEAANARITDLYWSREIPEQENSVRVVGIRVGDPSTLGKPEQVLWLPEQAQGIVTRAATAATAAGREWLFPSPIDPRRPVSETTARAALGRVSCFLPIYAEQVTPRHLRQYALRTYGPCRDVVRESGGKGNE